MILAKSLFVLLGLLGVFFVLFKKKGELGIEVFLIWFILFVSFALLIIFVEKTTFAANVLGIFRGVDLLIYLGFIFVLFLIMSLFAKIDKMNYDIARIVRHLAIDNEVKKHGETSYNQDYTKYQLKGNWLRKIARRQIYTKNVLKYVKGKTIDFGCGTGELMSMLPQGSIGFDINESTVEYCRIHNLNVELYNPEVDNYLFSNCEVGKYKTFVISNVLEHLKNPDNVIKTIIKSCNRLKIERVVITVPEWKGFKYDWTHITFIDYEYIKNYNLRNLDGYQLTKQKRFPFNFSIVGNYFVYNELIIIYDKID